MDATVPNMSSFFPFFYNFFFYFILGEEHVFFT